MSTRPPTDLWDWQRALVAAQVSDGAWATAHAWSTQRWRWARGMSEADVVASEGGMTLEDFRRRYRTQRAVSSVRRDFTELLAAGLLERVRRGSWASGTVYVPRVPGRARGVVAEEFGPEHSAHQRAEYSAHIPEDWAQYSAQERLALRSPAPVAPTSPRTPEPPSRVGAQAPARGTTPGEGGSGAPEQHEAASRALDQVLGALPSDVTACITPRGRQEATSLVAELLSAGWRASWLATDVSRGSWERVADHDSVLLHRLRKQRQRRLPDQPRPQVAVPAAPPTRETAESRAQPVQVRAPSNLRQLVDGSRAAARRPDAVAEDEPTVAHAGEQLVDEPPATEGSGEDEDDHVDHAERPRLEVGA